MRLELRPFFLFILAFSATFTTLVMAAQYSITISDIFDWLYNVSTKINPLAREKPGMYWDYMVSAKTAKTAAGSVFALAYNVTIDVNTTSASPDASINSTIVLPEPGLPSTEEPRTLFRIYANGTSAMPGGGGSICPTPRACGLRLGWGQLYYTDVMGNPSSPAAGRQVLIHVPIRADISNRFGKALVILEVHKYDPTTGSISIDENMAIGVNYALVGDGIEVTLLWWPREPGTYIIRAYIWNGFPGQVEKWESYIEPLQLVVNIS